MTRGTKLILIGFGVFALLVVGVIALIVGLIVYQLNTPESKRATAASQAAGREFGKSTDQQGCQTEGLVRAKPIRMIEISRMVDNEYFVEECLKSSRPTPGFCDGVPPLWKLNSDEWESAQCKAVHMDELATGCRSVFSAKYNFCRHQ
jgi:predicted membrane channel-forming protein YqfA (hemolysin III family)